MTTQQLIALAEPFSNVEGDNDFLDTYLTILLAGQDPNDLDALAGSTPCWMCFSDSTLLAIQNYLLCQINGGCNMAYVNTVSSAFQQVQDAFLEWIQTYFYFAWAAQ